MDRIGALLDEMPYGQRDEARHLVTHRILPDGRSARRRINQDLPSACEPASPSGWRRRSLRTGWPPLRSLVREVQIETLYRAAISLAIARYVHDGHYVAGGARTSVTPDITRLSDRPAGTIEAEAIPRDHELADWYESGAVANAPDMMQAYGTVALHTRLTLASAQSSSSRRRRGVARLPCGRRRFYTTLRCLLTRGACPARCDQCHGEAPRGGGPRARAEGAGSRRRRGQPDAGRAIGKAVLVPSCSRSRHAEGCPASTSSPLPACGT